MKYFLPTLPVLMLLYACSPSKHERPNIIFIMADDHAASAISAYDTSLIQTPNIDRLAQQGIRFDQCYCTNAICAPSRAVILTGKYSHMNGVLDNARSFDGSQETLPKILRGKGYQTAMIGKWHLKSEPTGFDNWIVLPGQGQYYRPDFLTPGGKISIEGYVTDIITDKGIEFLENRDPAKPFFMMLHHKAPHRNWQPAIRHIDIFENKPFPAPVNLEEEYADNRQAAREQEMSIAHHMSLDYDLKMPEELLELKGSDRELFFNTDWTNPRNRMPAEQFSSWTDHYTRRADDYNALPNDSLAIDVWKYRKYMEDYLSCIHTLDENIGRLLDYLEETGLDKNTIVIYTSDQGFFLGEHGWYDKRFMYNEAHQMPLLVKIPETNPHIDQHMIINADFAPTILALAGLDVPVEMQGTSFHSILEGNEPGQWRKSVYYHYFEYPAVHGVKRHFGIRTQKYKLIHFYYDIDTWELYDLEKDPHEMNNVLDDPVYTMVLQQLRKELESLQQYYRDTDYQVYLPVEPETIEHLAIGKSYTLVNLPSERYPGKDEGLTDGIAYPAIEAVSFDNENWCGFREDDFIIRIDLGKEMTIREISAGFLQDQSNWIFAPVNVEFMTSSNGIDFMSITNNLCNGIEKDDRVMKLVARAQYPGIKARYIMVKAKNNALPEWHGGAGKPAWLFVDEIMVMP